LSKFEDAQTSFDSALAGWKSLGDKREEAITLVADARLRQRRGEYQEALNRFEEALTLLEPMGDPVWEGATLTGKGTVYFYMAETTSAIKLWERALDLFEKAGLKDASADALLSLGSTYLASGQDKAALSRLERALAIGKELGNERWQALALNKIGLVYLFRRQPDVAQQYLRRSLEVQQSPSVAGDPRLESETIANIGDVNNLLGRYQEAHAAFDEALTLSKRGRDRVKEARALFGLARTSGHMNNLEGAREYIDSALSVAENLRTEVESRDLRASYFASVQQYHELRMDVLMRLHKLHPQRDLAAAAFQASERARARSLLDSLNGAGVDLRADVAQNLLKREQTLKNAFDDWAARQRRLGEETGTEAKAAGLAEEYRDLEERYNQIQSEIRSKSPRYAALVRPQPLSLKEIQKQVLDRDTLLLEYTLGDERSYLWAVSQNDFSSYELPPRAEIESAAHHVYELLTARLTATGTPHDRRRQIEQADNEYWREAGRLSDILLGPAAAKMAGKRILVVADGALQYLPFAALPIPGHGEAKLPMVVEHEIVSLPSASVLAVLRQETGNRQPPTKAIAVFADPVFEADDPRLAAKGAPARRGTVQGHVDAVQASAAPNEALIGAGILRDGSLGVPRLAATRQEADAIVAVAPQGTTLNAVDFDASRATAMSPNLAQYRIVHFATHGVFNSDQPGLGGIILSMYDKEGRPQNGFLRLHDIYNLNLPAELVVLSACNTALGKSIKGEGLVGIVRGFMYAGAKRVVASDWKVDDEATGELMARFYEEMFKQNRSPAAALRQAQLAMRQYDRWQSPFYWAAFVLQGEWR
jgi:CHAT domain-containing protein